MSTSVAAPLSHGVRRAARAASTQEARRQFVVRAVFFIYILSLLEGPLRKWFLPGLAGPLTLLRDPFVITLYVYCLMSGMIWRRGLAAIWLGFAVFTSWLGLAQYMFNGLPLSGWLLGVRTYWLYMPLAFVIARTFQYEDVRRFLQFHLWLALPYAVLVAMQYNAGPGAFINRGVGSDEEAAVGLGSLIVRPFGLFTYTGPNNLFVASMIAMFISAYLFGSRHFTPRYIMLIAAFGVAAMSVLTGSRSIYFLAAIIISLSAFGLVVVRPTVRNIGRVLGIAVFVMLAALLFVQIFPDMLQAMQMRFERAAANEGSIWARAFSGFVRPVMALGTAPLLGEGIGAGAPGAARFIGLPPLIFGEAELERNINELGLFFGVLFIFLRFGTAAWLVWLSVRLAKNGALVAMPLVGFILQPLIMGQVTHSPINGFMIWVPIGLVLCMARRAYG